MTKLISCKRCWKILPNEEGCGECPKCGLNYDAGDGYTYYGYEYKWYKPSDFICSDLLPIWIVLAILVIVLPISPIYTAPIAFLGTQNMVLGSTQWNRVEIKLTIFHMLVNESLMIIIFGTVFFI